MSIICKLFGHAPLTRAGWQAGVGYAEVHGSAHDGIGRWHLFLYAKCPRCGEGYAICNAHVPERAYKPSP
jgi:hypothetical protein